jgi:Flp pilus assembly pilin Flp
MKKFVGHIQRFLHDDQGQTTTEYILILAVVVMIAMKFKTMFQGRLEKAVGQLGGNMDQMLQPDSN